MWLKGFSVGITKFLVTNLFGWEVGFHCHEEKLMLYEKSVRLERFVLRFGE